MHCLFFTNETIRIFTVIKFLTKYQQGLPSMFLLCFTRIMQTSVVSYFYLIGHIPVAVHHDIANYIIRVYSKNEIN